MPTPPEAVTELEYATLKVDVAVGAAPKVIAGAAVTVMVWAEEVAVNAFGVPESLMVNLMPV